MIKKVLRKLELFESALLGVILIAMVVIATLQIVLRNFFDTGLVWADPLLRVMLLWLGMLGAMAASHDNKHISIDLLSKFLPAKGLVIVRAVTALFTALVCSVVAWHSARFVIDEFHYQTPAGVSHHLPAWPLQLIIPFAFVLIALRYYFLMAQAIAETWHGDSKT